MGDIYRIRWGIVQVCNGYRCWHERGCIAERWVQIVGPLGFWCSVKDGGWRTSEDRALRDVAHDRHLRTPLPPTRDLPNA